MVNQINSIHISDIHFGKKDDERLYNELNKNFLDYLQELFTSIKYKDYEFIFIQGDLFDRVIKMNEKTSVLIFNFIEKLCKICDYKNNHQKTIQIRLIKGTKSHDYNQLKTLELFENQYNFFKIIYTYSDEEYFINGKTINILYIPEEYPEDINSFYEFDKIEDNEYDYIIGHGMIDIVRFNSEDQKEETMRHGPIFNSKELSRICKGPICFGHIHDYQEWKDKIFYTGSFSRFSFADQKDKGFLEFTYNLDDNTFNTVLCENELAPTYKVLDFSDFDENSSEEKINIINDYKSKYDFIKVKSINNQDNVDVLKEILSDNENIKIEVKKDIEENEIDERFKFILNREFDLKNTIQKYIEITQEKTIPLNLINEIISNE